MHKFNTWMKRAAIASSALILMTACATDHFDVKAEAGGEKTLWANIAENSELSDFAAILQRVKVLKDVNDRSATLRVSEMLNQNQSFTMWAPLNGTFNAKAWNDSLDVVEQLYQQGTEESKNKARLLDYKIWQQFAANHIARFNHEGYDSSRKVRLLNNKHNVYDGSTFNGVSVVGAPIIASNGGLHLINGASPFAYNIYDYIASAPDFSRLNAYIKLPEFDKNTFSPDRSVPGAMNEEGKMVYIDSVYIHNNELLGGAGAQISNEDSVYIALIPNNAAWNEAIEKVGQLYQYGNYYSYDWQVSGFTKNNPSTQLNLGKKTLDGSQTLGDSLRLLNVRQKLVRNLFFSPSRFRNVNQNDSAALINYVLKADSLISTAHTTYYNPAAVEGAVNAGTNPVLAGIKPYHASNGYIFPLQSYDFNPAYSFVQKQQLYPHYASHFATSNNTTYTEGTTIRLTSVNYNVWGPKVDENFQPVFDADGNPVYAGVKGEVENNTYTRFERQTDREMSVDLRLPEMYSTYYTIKVVLLPSQIDFNYVDESAPAEVVRFNASIVDDENKVDAANVVTIDQERGQFDPNSVNEIVLWEKYKFNKCYVDLGPNITSFPRLRLTLPARTFGTQIRCKALNIVKVIVEPYRGDQVAP